MGGLLGKLELHCIALCERASSVACMTFDGKAGGRIYDYM